MRTLSRIEWFIFLWLRTPRSLATGCLALPWICSSPWRFRVQQFMHLSQSRLGSHLCHSPDLCDFSVHSPSCLYPSRLGCQLSLALPGLHCDTSCLCLCLLRCPPRIICFIHLIQQLLHLCVIQHRLQQRSFHRPHYLAFPTLTHIINSSTDALTSLWINWLLESRPQESRGCGTYHLKLEPLPEEHQRRAVKLLREVGPWDL
mmetsp:Transcript_28409/g.34503  ORF Transcript_28409/g.34503 Transcript_28409/m.34503 type:complete len:203 (-) Transcript_28409:1257-1865(-)